MNKSEDDRTRRLAEALRQNLRRRKAQAREAQEAGDDRSSGQRSERG